MHTRTDRKDVSLPIGHTHSRQIEQSRCELRDTETPADRSLSEMDLSKSISCGSFLSLRYSITPAQEGKPCIKYIAYTDTKKAGRRAGFVRESVPVRTVLWIVYASSRSLPASSTGTRSKSTLCCTATPIFSLHRQETSLSLRLTCRCIREQPKAE